MRVYYNNDNKFTGYEIDVFDGIQQVGDKDVNIITVPDDTVTARNIQLGFLPVLLAGEIKELVRPEWMVAQEKEGRALAWASKQMDMENSLAEKKAAIKNAKNNTETSAAVIDYIATKIDLE